MAFTARSMHSSDSFLPLGGNSGLEERAKGEAEREREKGRQMR